jgi:hypothetical protein
VQTITAMPRDPNGLTLALPLNLTLSRYGPGISRRYLARLARLDQRKGKNTMRLLVATLVVGLVAAVSVGAASAYGGYPSHSSTYYPSSTSYTTYYPSYSTYSPSYSSTYYPGYTSHTTYYPSYSTYSPSYSSTYYPSYTTRSTYYPTYRPSYYSPSSNYYRPSYYSHLNAAGYPKNQWVNGYYRSNGTYVHGYWRNSPNDGLPTCRIIHC